jgi:D-beta-D-heptose 7-phosphate kinase/D-beta-D-heptose 1-phosphate adenosyltransferase
MSDDNRDSLRPERVLASLKQARHRRVWVVGDLMMDEYVEGDVGRVSPEAPVPVVHVRRTFHRLGGAANVAHGVTVLGASASLCGAIGDDDAGDMLLSMCTQAGIGTDAVLKSRLRPTTRKVRVLAQNQQVLRLDWETKEPFADDELGASVNRLSAGGPPNAVILSDYAKGFLTRETIARVIQMARAADAPVIIDPKSRDLSRYAGASLLTPNLSELELACGEALHGASDARIEAAARSALRDVDIGALLVTLGERGMMLVPRNGKADTVRTVARDVYDVTGAGDTVVAVLAVGLAAGLRLSEAARLSNAAAGVVVGKLGTSTAGPSEIASALALHRADKVLERDEIKEQVAWWRLQGKRVVFTNGCYDLVHSGHIALLREASRLGDVLVVALNTDASVARLKGPSRPILNERDRLDHLAALECVDAVTLFDEDTPLELIRELVPDVLVKGGDYRLHEIVGADVVEAAGGTVRTIPLVHGRSTSEMIRRIRHSDE